MYKHQSVSLFTYILAGIICLAMVILTPSRSSSEEREVFIIELEGVISPATAMFLARGIEEAETRGAEMVVIRLDTPGGLVSSMRTMVKAIMNARVPVVVYVSPKGAGAASAGVMVTVAAHVAAMAPSTNIGAAHPVTAGGKDIQKTMSEKVVNDMASYGRGIAQEKGRNAEWVEMAIRESVSITADEAVKKNVVDLVAPNLDKLLKVLDGREIILQENKVTLRTKDLVKIYYKPGFRDKILQIISHPNIAYILMMIGLAGLYFELSNPGVIFPGVIGAISLILAFYSFQVLEVDYAGFFLIALAILLFIAEIKITSYGVLSLGGLVSLTLGSIMLFRPVGGLPWKTLMPTIVLVGGFFSAVSIMAFRAYSSRPKGGMDGLIGEVGLVKEIIDREGLIFVHGEYWRASAREKIEAGERVEVESAEGLILKVKRAIKKDF